MRALKVIVSCVAFASLASGVLAQGGTGQPPAGERPARGPGQGGPGGRQLDPEKAKAAWELQATGVSKRLGLNADQTKGVVKAYTESRESVTKATQKLREDNRDNEDRQAMRKATEDMTKAEREKLQKAIAAVAPDHAEKAVASLGTFNLQWDRMADVLGGMKLEGEKQQNALNAVETYVVALAAARPAGPDADREAMRAASQEARTKLTDSLKKVLSEEEMKKFDEATRMGGGRGGEGGGRRGGGGGGGGGGDRDN